MYHKNCSTGSVEDVSKSISSSETNDLYDIVSDMKSNLESSLTAVESNIDDLDVQKRSMFKQVQELYAVMISKAKKWFANETTEIDTVYHSQLSVLKQMHAILNTVVSRIESSIAQINTLRSKTVDTKLFQGSKIALVRSYLRVPQDAGQVKILEFLVKIIFSHVCQYYCNAAQVSIFRYFEACIFENSRNIE